MKLTILYDEKKWDVTIKEEIKNSESYLIYFNMVFTVFSHFFSQIPEEKKAEIKEKIYKLL